MIFLFFFQAEDGIRDYKVTGVQTCALPIWRGGAFQSSALTGYPIEMLLHALRPYLTIFHCSEDALGLFWFLLDQGKVYLQTRPSFMLGLTVATFTSLTKFLNSTQESTTQERHFQATMSKVQSFHKWF